MKTVEQWCNETNQEYWDEGYNCGDMEAYAKYYHEEKLKELTDNHIRDAANCGERGDYGQGWDCGFENGGEWTREWYLDNL